MDIFNRMRVKRLERDQHWDNERISQLFDENKSLCEKIDEEHKKSMELRSQIHRLESEALRVQERLSRIEAALTE